MLSKKGALFSVQFGGCVQTTQSFSSSMSEDTEGCGGNGRVTCGVKRRQRHTFASVNNSLQGPQKSQGSHKKYLITHPKGLGPLPAGLIFSGLCLLQGFPQNPCEHIVFIKSPTQGSGPLLQGLVTHT